MQYHFKIRPAFKFVVGDKVAHKTDPGRSWIIISMHWTQDDRLGVPSYTCSHIDGGDHVTAEFSEVELDIFLDDKMDNNDVGYCDDPDNGAH